jgi:hypothetical protein
MPEGSFQPSASKASKREGAEEQKFNSFIVQQSSIAKLKNTFDYHDSLET